MRLGLKQGITLVETILFILVISIALVVLLRAFDQSLASNVDPVVRVRALQLAQAQLDEILARKFDENTPIGGVPRCGAAGINCAGIVADSDYDDVGDFNGLVDTGFPRHRVSVTVVNAGADIGLADADARLITVRVSYADDELALSAYKVNF